MKEIIRFLIRNVPRNHLVRIGFFSSGILSICLRGSNVYCPICDRYFRRFLPYGVNPRDNSLCPGCLSLGRHRLIWLYLRDRTDLFTKKGRLLHVAPEQCFYREFNRSGNLDYITADLDSCLARIRMDVQDVPFKNDQFDAIICNHVLEHVDNDLKAMSEFLNVLKPGGWAILQVPIKRDRPRTYEYSNSTSKSEREKDSGHKGHLRAYGLDYPERLGETGFCVDPVNYTEDLDDETIERYRLSNQLIYVAKKL